MSKAHWGGIKTVEFGWPVGMPVCRQLGDRVCAMRTSLRIELRGYIDKKGRMYWARFGGEPFSDLEFLTKQLDRMNEMVKAETAGPKAD